MTNPSSSSDACPVRVHVDNPGGAWLEDQQQAALWRATQGGVVAQKMIDGAATAWIRDIALPSAVLATIPGASDEQRRLGNWHFDTLLAKVNAEGWSDEWPVLVVVNHQGQPYLVEGNSRVAVAHATGVSAVPVEVRWVNGGEQVDGALTPARVEALAFALPAPAAAPPVEFRTWFGPSKAVDEDGRPMVLYHGSHQPLESVMTAEQVMAAFDANTAGLPANVVKGERAFVEQTAGALWFTDSQDVAEGYADQRKGTPTVTPAYLQLLNPLNLADMSREEVAEVLSAARGQPQTVSNEYGWARAIAQAVVRDAGALIQYAKANGFDGLIYPDTCVAGRSTHTSYVIFEPGQVRLAASVDAADLRNSEEDDDTPACRL